MAELKEGTKEWASQLHRTAARHTRALDQLNQAVRFMASLEAGWESLDQVVKSALFTAAVIHYARPFGKNKGGGAAGSYGIGRLKKAPGFDRVLHGHLLDLRDKLIAHQDGTVLKARVGHCVIELHDHGLQIPAQTFGVVSALEGLATRELADRYLKHLTACAEAVGQRTVETLLDANRAAHQYPDTQSDMHKATLFSKREMTAGKTFVPVPFENEATNIQAPQFPAAPDGYMWRRTLVTVTPSAKYEWKGPDGAPASIEVSSNPTDALGGNGPNEP
jgi:hypothetical protein